MPVRAAPTSGDKPPRRPPSEQEPVSVPHGYSPQSPEASPTANSIATVERHSSSTLPTNVVLSLSQLGLDDRDVVRAARIAARTYAFDQHWLFGNTDPRKYISKITGQPASMRDAQRFTNAYAPVAVASMLRDAETERFVGSRHRGGESVKPASAARIGEMANAIARGAPDVELPTGIALAVKLVQDKVKPELVEQNLRVVQAWAGTTGFDDKSALGIAISLSQSGRRVHSSGEVDTAVFGRQAVTNRENYEATVAWQEKALQASTWAELRDLGPAPTGGSEFGSQFELGPDYWKQINDLSNQVKLDDEAFQHSIVGQAFNVVGKVTGGLWQGTERALVELGIGLVTPVALGISAGLSPFSDFDPGETLKNIQRGRSDAITRLNMGESIGDWVEEGIPGAVRAASFNKVPVFALPEWTSSAFDFAVGWYVDPFVVAGKIARITRGVDAFAIGDKVMVAGRTVPHIDEALSLTEKVLEKVPGVGTIVVNRKNSIDKILQAGFKKYVFEKLPNSRVADKLFESAYKSNNSYFRSLDLYAPGKFTSRTLDYEYMKLLRDRMLLKFPEKTAEARNAFGEGLSAHFIGYGPEGSIAEWAAKARVDRAKNSLKEAVASNAPDSEVGQALSEYLAMGGDNIGHVPFSPEGPGVHALYGPRRAIRRGVTSQRVTETALGKRLSGLPNINPGRVLNPHDNPDEYLLMHSRRWGVFSEREVRRFQSETAEIVNKGVATEENLEKLAERINDEAFERIVKPYNMTDPAKAELKDILFGETARTNRRIQTFLVVPDAERIELQVFRPDTVQLQPTAELIGGAIPPLERQGYLYHVTSPDALPGIASSGLRPTPDSVVGQGAFFAQSPKAASKMATGAQGATSGQVVLRVREGSLADRVAGEVQPKLESFVQRDVPAKDIEFLGADGKWYPAASAKPSTLKALHEPQLETELRNAIYIPDPVYVRKVIHEYTGWGRRAHAQLDRALKKEAPEIASHIDRNAASKALQVTLGKTEKGLRAYRRFWKGATVARPGYIPRVILGDENARFLATTRSLTERIFAQEWWGLTKKLDEKGWLDEVVKFGDDPPVKIGLAGAMERNPLAQGMIRQSEQIEEMMRRSGVLFDRLTPTGSWNPLAATAEAAGRIPGAEVSVARNLNAWDWALSKQWAKSRPGQVALESVARGEDLATTRAALLNWAREDKFVTLRSRIGVDAGEYESWFNDVAAGAHAYTLGDPKIADLALRGTKNDLKKFLASKDHNARPVVHAPGVEAMLQGDTYLNGFVNDLYEWFVRGPEGRMNRQPFFKNWKRRTDVAYNKLLASQGLKLTPELKNAIDVASTQFGLEQVRRVMFDLSRQSRFTELLQFVFPFPQPFFEGFQTWGAIAMRNPESVGRIAQLFRTGADTGFIRKDESTGEYVVPMGWYRNVAGLLWGLGADSRLDKLGINFVAPATAFNMIASTTVKFGAEGWIGKVIGGVPIPVPGMEPGAGLLLQQLFKNSKSMPITSYLFQYGPSTSATLLPPTLKLLVGKMFPGVIPEEQIQALSYSIIRAYQKEGLDKVDGHPISFEELEKMAMADAKELWYTRQFMNLFSAASLRTKTSASPYEAEWQATYGESQDYFQAIDSWIANHPDLSYVPIGKTFFAAGVIEDKGQKITAPRLPSSRLVGEMLDTPGIGDWMRANPAWAGLTLIGLDPAIVNDQDFATYSRMISDHLLEYKPIAAEFLPQGANLEVWNEIDQWYKQVWDPRVSLLIDGKGLDTQNTAYRDLLIQRKEFLTDLATRYPNWANLNLEKHDDVEDHVYYDWPGGEDTGKPVTLALAQARAIADTPGFDGAPGFIALRGYLELRDSIQAKMQKAGYTDIMQDSAVESGLTKEFADGVRDLEKETPGISAYLGAMFGIRLEDEAAHGTPRSESESGGLLGVDDLRNLTPSYTAALLKLEPEQRKAVDKLDVEYELLRDAAHNNFQYDWQQSQRYADAAQFFDHKFYNDRATVQNWWESQGKTARAEYRQGLATKPTIFYSAWDWHLQGVDVSKEQANWLAQLADKGVQIAKREEDDPGFSEGDAYAARDRWVRDRIKEDKGFGKLVDKMNSWTTGLRAAGYPKLPGHAGDAWTRLLDAIDETQASIPGGEVTGVKDYDPKDSEWYDAIQDYYIGWVNDIRQWSKPFNRTWLDLNNALDSPVIGGEGLLVPDTYFPLGGHSP